MFHVARETFTAATIRSSKIDLLLPFEGIWEDLVQPNSNHWIWIAGGAAHVVVGVANRDRSLG